MNKVKFQCQDEADFRHNYSLLQTGFSQRGITKVRLLIILPYYYCITVAFKYRPELIYIELPNDLDVQKKDFFEITSASFCSLSQWKSS